jgi:hypothetical protein
MSPKRVEQILKALAHWKTVPYNVNAAKTHCPSGHEYTPENTYHETRPLMGKAGGIGKYRVCRKCRNAARDRKIAAKNCFTNLSRDSQQGTGSAGKSAQFSGA